VHAEIDVRFLHPDPLATGKTPAALCKDTRRMRILGDLWRALWIARSREVRVRGGSE
jgi:hypothetical protein